MVSTKIDLNCGRIDRIDALDELAAILFPNNRNHQRVFLAIFIELKWSEKQFLPILEPVASEYQISRRTLETVRAKMRRMGVIDHVSRFNKKYGYRGGWVFSNRFARTLQRLVDLPEQFREPKNAIQEQKDRDLFRYIP